LGAGRFELYQRVTRSMLLYLGDQIRANWVPNSIDCVPRFYPMGQPASPANRPPLALGDEDASESMAVRRQTNSGRPCGSSAFMERIEALLGRVVRPRKRGRKAKEALPAAGLF